MHIINRFFCLVSAVTIWIMHIFLYFFLFLISQISLFSLHIQMDIQLHSPPPFTSPKSDTTNEGASLTDNLKHIFLNMCYSIEVTQPYQNTVIECFIIFRLSIQYPGYLFSHIPVCFRFLHTYFSSMQPVSVVLIESAFHS